LAGEHTCGLAGYMESAVRSGHRVAAQIGRPQHEPAPTQPSTAAGGAHGTGLAGSGSGDAGSGLAATGLAPQLPAVALAALVSAAVGAAVAARRSEDA
jgi:hypothetical protein